MRRRELIVASGVFGLLGCADPEVAAQAEAVTNREATPVTPGSSLDLHLVPRAGSELTDGNAGVFALELEAGQTVAVALRRRRESALRGYLAAYGPERERTDRRHGQRELMMAHPDDALLVFTAARPGPHLIVATDEDLAVDVDVQVDFVALDAPLGFGLTTHDPAADAYVAELRRLEPELARFFDAGTVWEMGNGYLDVDEADVPLRDRADLRRLVPRVNETREDLFAALSESAPDAAAMACGAMWLALRRNVHRLRSR